jgi:glycosyltransferase involved in cell wall biosynthesis
MASVVETIPARVVDLEVSEPLSGVAAVDEWGRRVEQVWLLVRVFGEPLGFVVLDVPAGGLGAGVVGVAVRERFGSQVAARIGGGGGSGFVARRVQVLAQAPEITVVVCTRERPVALARCLDSVLALRYPRFRVLVVDNAPRSEATREVVVAAGRRGPVEYLLAPVAGLSRARNAAVAAAAGEILAWVDDDEVVDGWWLAEVARGLADHPAADVVCGAIVPAELVSRAQVWFEQFGGHSKGRGFTPAVFSPASARVQSPLYPLPPFGTGANMTFRPGVIEGIGGFDPALGAGSAAMGSEDTLAFTQVLRAGGMVVYQPAALTRHYHRRDLAGLRAQMVGYGVGLTAAYTSLVLADPRVLWPLARLVPTAVRDMRAADGPREAGLGEDFPRELLAANRRGMLYGPIAYLRGRVRSRRVDRSGSRS